MNKELTPHSLLKKKKNKRTNLLIILSVGAAIAVSVPLLFRWANSFGREKAVYVNKPSTQAELAMANWEGDKHITTLYLADSIISYEGSGRSHAEIFHTLDELKLALVRKKQRYDKNLTVVLKPLSEEALGLFVNFKIYFTELGIEKYGINGLSKQDSVQFAILPERE
ncbi:MAG: hypothetical protein AAFY71_27910 [Bacteroidota bacterium]